jgi:hypothetical protein
MSTRLSEQSVDGLSPEAAKPVEESLGATCVLNHHRQNNPDDNDQAQIEQAVSHGVLLTGPGHDLGQKPIAQSRTDKQPDNVAHAHTSFPFPVTMFQPQFTITATRMTAIQNAGCFA